MTPHPTETDGQLRWLQMRERATGRGAAMRPIPRQHAAAVRRSSTHPRTVQRVARAAATLAAQNTAA
jgi:hypothetical protein